MNLIAEDASPSREEVYQALVRSLRRRKGFGIVFVQCSPAEATKLIKEIQTDLPQKQFANLNFDAPVDNLYDIVDELPNRENLNILFIQGLEKSLEPYIKPGYGGDGDYYNLDTVPTILGHLNQRRELFRDHFHNICFVFFLPLFAIKYIIRRSPDLFDWSAGVFEFSSEDGLQRLQDNHSQYLANTQGTDNIWLNEGHKLARLGRYDEAILSFAKALEINPESCNALLNRGAILCDQLKLYEKALDDFNKCLEINPNEHWAWHNRGVALSKLGRYEEAIASYDKAIETSPYYDWNYVSRGITFSELGRYEEAIASHDKAIEINPNEYWAWHNRGVALRNLGRYEEAIASHDKAIEISPYYEWNYISRGITLSKLGRYEEAIASFDKALEIKPDLHEAWSVRGIALGNLGRNEEAIASFDKALEIKPDDDAAWNNRGYALVNLGRYEESISSFDKALGIKPDYYQAWQNRGYALMNLGQYKEAISNYQQCLIIVRETGDLQGEINTLRNLGVAYFKMRQYRKGYGFIQQSVNLIDEIGDLNLETYLSYLGIDVNRLGLKYFQKSVNLFKKFWKLIGRVVFSLDE